jgi:hypothetical protein
VHPSCGQVAEIPIPDLVRGGMADTLLGVRRRTMHAIATLSREGLTELAEVLLDLAEPCVA